MFRNSIGDEGGDYMKKQWKMALLAAGMCCIFGSTMAANAAVAVPVPKAAGPVNTKIELEVPLARPEIKQISNVVYSQVPTAGYDNVALRMDILQPVTKEKKPAVVYVPGGGFIHANKDKLVQARMALAEAGYVVAAIEYRVAPGVSFPKPLEDVKSAVRYLRAHADQYGIDADHIGLFGNSAGGYLVGIAGTTNSISQFDVGENLNQSSAVQAVCDWYGVSDLTKIGADYGFDVQKLHNSAGATEALWLKGTPVFNGKDGGVKDYMDLATAANPLHYISTTTPPFLIMHGTSDKVVSPSESDIFYKALRDKGIEATEYKVKHAEHGGAYWAQPQILDLVVNFFNAHLKVKGGK